MERKRIRWKNLLNWAMVCHPKKVGGMGITNLKILNHVIFCKWWWNAFSDIGKSWRELIKIGYNSDQLISLNLPTSHKLLEFWRSALKVKGLFQAMVKFTAGNGKQISFWGDSWLLDQPIKELFPLLFIASPLKEITVAEALESSLATGAGSLHPG